MRAAITTVFPVPLARHLLPFVLPFYFSDGIASLTANYADTPFVLDAVADVYAGWFSRGRTATGTRAPRRYSSFIIVVFYFFRR